MNNINIDFRVLHLKQNVIAKAEDFLRGRTPHGPLLDALDTVANDDLRPEQLEEFVDVVSNLTCAEQQTVLIKLASAGTPADFERCKRFIRNLSAPDPHCGFSAMHYAVYFQSLDNVRWLADNGVSVDIPNPSSKITPFMIAVRDSRTAAALFLMDNYEDQIDFGAADSSNQSVLNLLINNGTPQIFERALRLKHFSPRLDLVRAELEAFDAEMRAARRGPLSILRHMEDKRKILLEFEKQQLDACSINNEPPPAVPSIRI